MAKSKIQFLADAIEKAYKDNPTIGQARDYYALDTEGNNYEYDSPTYVCGFMCPILAGAVGLGYPINGVPYGYKLRDFLKEHGIDLYDKYQYNEKPTSIEDVIYDMEDKQKLDWQEIVNVLRTLKRAA